MYNLIFGIMLSIPAHGHDPIVIDRENVAKQILEYRVEMASLCFNKNTKVDANNEEPKEIAHFCASYHTLDLLLHNLGINQYPDKIKYIDLESMVLNCLHEANTESFEGKVEVNRVVLKRTKSKRWPDNIKDVIMQPKQFSWTMESPKKFNSKSIDSCFKATNKAIELGPSKYNHYYNANEVTPTWSTEFVEMRVIGNHTFLKLK